MFLQIGCGAGLPGILSLLKGADFVAFQDYVSLNVNLHILRNLVNSPGVSYLTTKMEFMHWVKNI